MSEVESDTSVVLLLPAVASVGTVISQKLTTSTMTSRTPLLPICVYRSLILGKTRKTVSMCGGKYVERCSASVFQVNISGAFLLPVYLHSPTKSLSVSFPPLPHPEGFFFLPPAHPPPALLDLDACLLLSRGDTGSYPSPCLFKTNYSCDCAGDHSL